MRAILFAICLFGVLGAEPCSLTLQEAEMVALSHSNAVQSMRQLVAEAEAGRLVKLSQWLPQVQYLTRGYALDNRDVLTKSKSAFIAQLSATQEVISTKKYYDVKISGLLVQLMRRLLDAAVIDVLYEVRTSYYQVILDRETVDTTLQNIELFTSLAEQAQADWRIGTSILLNFNQAKVAVANSTASYYMAVKQLRVDRDRLVRVLGYDPGSVEFVVAESAIPVMEIPDIAEKVERVEAVFASRSDWGPIFLPDYPASEARLMEGLFSQGEVGYWEQTALAFRPQLLSAETEVRIARVEVRQARGAYAPKIHLEGAYGGYPNRMLDFPSSNFFNARYRGAIGFEVQWSLFQGGGRAHKVCKALSRRRAKQYDYKLAQQVTFERVRGQIFEMEEATSSLVTAEANVRLAGQTVELAQNQLNIGYITIFDYQSVVDAYIQALNLRNQARYDLIKGYYGLRHASGVDLQERSCGNRRQF